MDKIQILANYEKGLASEGKTRNIFLRYAEEFLKFSNGSFDRDIILKYIAKLRRKKQSDGTVNFAFRVIRTVYNRNSDQLTREGVEWPFRRGETPQIREDQVVAPALSPNILIEMIEAIKERGTGEQQTILALSTTYGLRRAEMLQLDPPDVNIKDKTIHIKTLKHGRERTHKIPDLIVPWLKEYNFENHISEFALLILWHNIEHLIDFSHQERVGFHSIRRTLNTLLLDQLPENVVMSFLRMPYRYSAQRFVGREGTEVKVVGEARDVDDKVFQVHPFIEYWR